MMQEIKFEEKWQGIRDKKNLDEFSLFVPKGTMPRTQRQINLYWYHKFFNKIISGKKYSKGLELGCGRGTMSLYLNKYNGIEVTLSDISEDAIELAKDGFAKYAGEGNFIVTACDALPFADSSFDIVYSIGLLEHLSDYKKTLEESCRVLKSGGIMISLNIPFKWSVQNINNGYKKILKIFTGKTYSLKDYYRNNDKPRDFLRTAEEAGFKNVSVTNVNPFPIFVPIPMSADRGIAMIYNAIMRVRSLFMKYPFKTNYLFSQGHFLIGYKQ